VTKVVSVFAGESAAQPQPLAPGSVIFGSPRQVRFDRLGDRRRDPLLTSPGAISKTIQIYDVPERVHRTLKVWAAMARMSLSEFVLNEL
jgi:hypothetical protein